MKTHLVVECRGCRINDESLTEFQQDFTFDSLDFPLYKDAVFVISAFRGQPLHKVCRTAEFCSALTDFLTHAVVRSEKVFYRPHPKSGSRKEKTLSLLAEEVATQCPPGPGKRRFKVEVQPLPSDFPQLEAQLRPQKFENIAVAVFSSDGKRLLTVHSKQNNRACVWDLESETKLGDFEVVSSRHGSPLHARSKQKFETYIEAATLNRDGSRALAGLNDGSARLLNTVDGQTILNLTQPGTELRKEHFTQTRAVAFSNDESLVAVGFFDRVVAIWTTDGQLVRTLTHPLANRAVNDSCRGTLTSSLGFSADDRCIFAGFSDMTAGLWEISSGELLVDASDYAQETLDLKVVGESLLWATSGGAVWSGQSGESSRRVMKADQRWSEAKLNANGSDLAVTTPSGLLKRQDWQGRKVRLGRVSERIFRDKAVIWRSPTSPLLLYKSDETTLTVRDRAGLRHFGGSGEIEEFQVSEDESTVLLRRDRSEAELLFLQSGKVNRVPCPLGIAGTLSPDGALLAFAEAKDRAIEVWDVRRLQRLLTIPYRRRFTRLQFVDHNSALLCSDRGGLVARLELAPPHRLRYLHYPDLDVKAGALALKNDRTLIFRDRGIELWRGLESLIARLDVPEKLSYLERVWTLEHDHRSLVVEVAAQKFRRFSTQDGTVLGSYGAQIPRPVYGHPTVWLFDGQGFHHQGDYLRGGFLSIFSLAKQPKTVKNSWLGQAFLVDLHEPNKAGQKLRFEGYLRAAWLGEDEALLLNEKGRLFRTPLE